MLTLDEVKLSLRLTTNAFDVEIAHLIAAATLDLILAGVTVDTTNDLCKRAIITYCRMNFGQPDDYDRLKASYDEQKAQMAMSQSYRTGD